MQSLKYNYLVSEGTLTNCWYSWQQMIECRATTVFCYHTTVSAHRLSKHNSQLWNRSEFLFLLFEHDCVTIWLAEPNLSQLLQHRGHNADRGSSWGLKSLVSVCVFSCWLMGPPVTAEESSFKGSRKSINQRRLCGYVHTERVQQQTVDLHKVVMFELEIDLYFSSFFLKNCKQQSGILSVFYHFSL